MRGPAILIAFILAAPAIAQVRPHPGGSDPHLQVVDYSEGQIVQLTGVPGYQLMVELSPDEQVQSVALGDSGAWQVSLSKDGNRLFLKPVQADGATNMTVVTSVRLYAFDLMSSGGPMFDTPYTVQFRYPAPATLSGGSQYVDVSAASRRLSRYRVSGDRQLRPQSVSDDGQHTYISWPKGSPIPAVYTPDRSGKEVLLNGMMGTDDVYVVDGAPQRLTFRIDDIVARAERINQRKAR
jgi:type IV secretion system protein VirB9